MRPAVYSITNTITNECYVGSTKNLYNRSQNHRYSLRRGNHGNSLLQKSYDTYGEKAFVMRVERYCSADELLKLEQEVFDLKAKDHVMFNKGLDVADPLRGSKRPDADKSRRHLDKVRPLAHEALKQRLADDGELREQFRQRGIQSMKALQSNPEIQERRLEALRRQARTPEARAKRSALLRQQWKDGKHKKPVTAGMNKKPVINTQTGEVYKSVTEAAIAMGLSLTQMHRKVQGRKVDGGYKKSPKDFMWEWYEEKDL